MFIAALLQEPRNGNLSTDRWTDKEYVVYIHNGILLSHEKEQNNVICSNMDETTDYHAKWTKSDGEGQIPYDIIYMWNLKHDTNEPICKMKTESWTLRADWWLRGWRRGLGLADGSFCIQNAWTARSSYTAKNYVWCPMRNHNGKECLKRMHI